MPKPAYGQGIVERKMADVNYSGWGEEFAKVVSKIGEVGFTAILLAYIVACWWNGAEPNSLAWAGLAVFGANFGGKKLWTLIQSKTISK
jgi:hypothetical protein